MDGILSTLSGSLPQLGVGTVLAFVIGLLVKLLMDERTQHAKLLMDERTRHTTELDAVSRRHSEELERKGDRLAVENAREQTQHIADMADAREELRRSRAHIEALQITVDIERQARREAEDAAARALRGRQQEGP